MEKLRNAMREVQGEARFEHTLGVAYTAACLGMVYGVDSQKTLTAGLLHDCAKCLDSKEMLRLCEKYAIEVSELERRNPFLLHAKVGAKLAQDVYGQSDEDILNAIKYHTTGRENMSMLEKIIFVADYIEPGRNKAPNLEEIRKIAFIDIDSAIVKILQDTLLYLEKSGSEIDPATSNTLKYYNDAMVKSHKTRYPNIE